jgi:hypothetical protein
MTFQSEIQNIIDQTIIPNSGDDDNSTLLSNLSSYMYDTTLDGMISNDQYSKDIYNLQFNYPQINVMLSYFTDLKPEYRKKCILLCCIFLKIRGIDTPIVTPPAFSLDAGIDPASGPILGMPSIGLPNIRLPNIRLPKAPTIKWPSFFSRSNSTSASSPPIACDPKEFEIINKVDAVLDKFAEFIIASNDPSIIEQFNKIEWFKPFLDKYKTKTSIAFQDAVYALNIALQDLRNVIDKQIKETPVPEMVASLTNAKQLYTQITDEKNKIIKFKSANVKIPYEKPADFLKDYPIKKSKTCTIEKEPEKEPEKEKEKEEEKEKEKEEEPEKEKEKEEEKEKENEEEPEKENEKELSDLLSIAGLLLLLDDDHFY